MEEYFVQKCVTSDTMSEPAATISTWATAHRCECVMVQENAHASGASRAVLGSILRMTTASIKIRRVVLFTLEPPLAQLQCVSPTEKLVVLDYSCDWLCLEAALLAETPVESPLLGKMKNDLENVLSKSESSIATNASKPSPSPSARPYVVVLDSLNVLLEIYPLARILSWLRDLRRDPRVGSVIFRTNVGAMPSASVAQTLALESTAVVQVETHTSLRAYSILAKERRREIPKRMHGMVLLLRKKKNGRNTESVEYFQVSNGSIQYSSSSGDDTPTTASQQTPAPVPATQPAAHTTTTASRNQTLFSSSASSSSVSATTGSGRALPVSVDDVSFNLSISAEEQVAKRNVELPYLHQGGAESSGTNNLLFIDDDDPDWDDDDLDDDLDI